MNETRLTGLENLRTRFARLAALPSRANLSTRGTGEFARSIDVAEMKTENLDGFRVGTDDPAGFFVELGTFKRAGNPWLSPVLHGRLPRLKHNLRRLLKNAMK